MSLRSVAGAAAGPHVAVAAMGLLAAAGCTTAPSFKELRLAGQQEVVDHDIGVAKRLFEEALDLSPEDPYNLHDLGVCSTLLARAEFRRGHHPAAMRELDHAIEYYARAINAQPGFQAALLGKNIANELKGQFDEALADAEWAREFVGPSARQQAFLARELEERGDLDGALLRYRQAVVMEAGNATAQAELGRFFHRQNRSAEAIIHLQAAYRLNPTEPGVLRLLVELGGPVPQVTP